MLIYICEDTKEHLIYLQNLLEELAKELNLHLEIVGFESGEALISEVKKREPEVIFSDIEMSGMDGISLGKELKQVVPDTYLIFLTAFVEYAMKGYETRAYRYLLKPAEKEEISKILLDIFHERSKQRLLIVQNMEEEKVVPLHAVRYMKAEDKYSIIHTTEGEFLDRKSLQYYEEVLENFGFFRIHRKYLINMRYHKSIEGGIVMLDNDEKLPISRRKVTAYHARFLEMLEGGRLK